MTAKSTTSTTSRATAKQPKAAGTNKDVFPNKATLDGYRNDKFTLTKIPDTRPELSDAIPLQVTKNPVIEGHPVRSRAAIRKTRDLPPSCQVDQFQLDRIFHNANFRIFGAVLVEHGQSSDRWGQGPTEKVGSTWMPLGYKIQTVECTSASAKKKPTIIVGISTAYMAEVSKQLTVELLPCWFCTSNQDDIADLDLGDASVGDCDNVDDTDAKTSAKASEPSRTIAADPAATKKDLPFESKGDNERDLNEVIKVSDSVNKSPIMPQVGHNDTSPNEVGVMRQSGKQQEGGKEDVSKAEASKADAVDDKAGKERIGNSETGKDSIGKNGVSREEAVKDKAGREEYSKGEDGRKEDSSVKAKTAKRPRDSAAEKTPNKRPKKKDSVSSPQALFTPTEMTTSMTDNQQSVESRMHRDFAIYMKTVKQQLASDHNDKLRRAITRLKATVDSQDRQLQDMRKERTDSDKQTKALISQLEQNQLELVASQLYLEENRRTMEEHVAELSTARQRIAELEEQVGQAQNQPKTVLTAASISTAFASNAPMQVDEVESQLKALLEREYLRQGRAKDVVSDMNLPDCIQQIQVIFDSTAYEESDDDDAEEDADLASDSSPK
ncbi:hypothetical protein IAU59_007562 [Kwoniella sp. CBS 9459]